VVEYQRIQTVRLDEAVGSTDPAKVSKVLQRTIALASLVMIAGCTKETRTVGPDVAQTPPNGAEDPRAAKYENVFQVAQGGRYFTWYGCGGCHGSDAEARLDLGDEQWTHGEGVDQVYAFIASGHPGELASYGDRISAEQLWQLTAFVRSLPKLAPERRRRQDLDQIGEPQGSTWSGPVKRGS
jgi:mono/diheme cytochrome c family protein